MLALYELSGEHSATLNLNKQEARCVSQEKSDRVQEAWTFRKGSKGNEGAKFTNLVQQAFSTGTGGL